MNWLARLTTNQRLAAIAFVLGAVALLARPSTGTVVKVDAAELSRVIQAGGDRVAPRELADWIIRGTTSFRVVDLRDESAFASYHIPGAENVPLAALAGMPFASDEKIVLCSEDGGAASQAWVLLRAKGMAGSYVLAGGIAGWKNDVLFPVLSADATSDALAENARVSQVAARFGGAPRTPGTNAGAAATAAMPALPKVEAPVLPAGGAKPAAAAKKKKEGC